MQKIKHNITKEGLAARAETDHFFLLLKEKNQNVIQPRLTKLVEDINSFNQGPDISYYLAI